MVRYHALPGFHRELLHDMPTPCKSLIEAYREIIPTLVTQRPHPEYHITRALPPSAKSFRPNLHRVIVEH
jgi:hypothetical protein